MKSSKLLNCFIVLLLIVTSVFTAPIFAQEATTSAKNNYQLPYPGLLPDNPLYSLKVFRDRIIEFLIADPIKKAEFDLLSADKRLAIGIALFEKGKKDLAETTISKGENYFEDAIINIDKAKKEGRQLDPSLLLNIELSAKKHNEVLENLVAKASGDLKKRFTKDLSRVVNFLDQVSKLKL